MVSDAEVLEVVKLSCERSAAAIHKRMGRGVTSLATVAATAPFVGVLGTLLGIVTSFKGMAGERSACVAAIFEGLSEALVPAVLSVAISIVAFCSYQYLRSAIEAFDMEMEAASLALVNQLSRSLAR